MDVRTPKILKTKIESSYDKADPKLNVIIILKKSVQRTFCQSFNLILRHS